jgi:hypothetical protein
VYGLVNGRKQAGEASGKLPQHPRRLLDQLPTPSVPDEILANSENVNFFGVITVDVEAELAKRPVMCTGS